jgi:hypothetical protein
MKNKTEIEAAMSRRTHQELTNKIEINAILLQSKS